MYNWQVINILQDLRMDNSEVDHPSGSEGAKENWVEAVAFIKDETQQLAATGTVNGDIFIWENHVSIFLAMLFFTFIFNFEK